LSCYYSRPLDSPGVKGNVKRKLKIEI